MDDYSVETTSDTQFASGAADSPHDPNLSNTTEPCSRESDDQNSNIENADENDKCIVCLNGFSKGQELGTPDSCEHTFCLQCLLTWSKSQTTCPLDRSPFRMIYVRYECGGAVVRTEEITEVSHQRIEEDVPFDLDQILAADSVTLQTMTTAYSIYQLLLGATEMMIAQGGLADLHSGQNETAHDLPTSQNNFADLHSGQNEIAHPIMFPGSALPSLDEPIIVDAGVTAPLNDQSNLIPHDLPTTSQNNLGYRPRTQRARFPNQRDVQLFRNRQHRTRRTIDGASIATATTTEPQNNLLDAILDNQSKFHSRNSEMAVDESGKVIVKVAHSNSRNNNAETSRHRNNDDNNHGNHRIKRESHSRYQGSRDSLRSNHGNSLRNETHAIPTYFNNHDNDYHKHSNRRDTKVATFLNGNRGNHQHLSSLNNRKHANSSGHGNQTKTHTNHSNGSISDQNASNRSTDFQEKIIGQVKTVLKRHFYKNHINKEEYKDICRRAITKLTHYYSKYRKEIDSGKIRRLTDAYVMKIREKRKSSGK